MILHDLFMTFSITSITVMVFKNHNIAFHITITMYIDYLMNSHDFSRAGNHNLKIA